MKVSLEWLGSHLEGCGPLSAPTVADKLAEAGLQVAGIEPSPVQPQDSILDVEVTSNRNDCNSHRGLARELAAIFAGRLKAAPGQTPTLQQAAGGMPVPIKVEDSTLCPHYTARIIRGVKVAPSPHWLQDRLRAVGLRPVNNVVDITNFILHDLGQPLHAFDLAKLQGGCIMVRRGRPNEPFEAIDHSKHQLDPSIGVIADAERPVAIAGVMGGVDSEVTESTTDILLESARFDPLTTRNASRKLGLKSDSSYRFERGVDPAGVAAASLCATQMILQLAGGQVVGDLIEVGTGALPEKSATLRFARMRQVLGYDVPPPRSRAILETLGFSVIAHDERQITCQMPSWRLDCGLEEDLIEEVARLHGYQHIPVKERLEIVLKTPSAREKVEDVLVETLTAGGYAETINPTRLDDHLAGLFTTAEPRRVSARHGKGQSILRDNLAASLLMVAKFNQQSGAMAEDGLRLYELATCFTPPPPPGEGRVGVGNTGVVSGQNPSAPFPYPLPARGGEMLPLQPTRLGLLTTGSMRELRGLVEALLARLRLTSRVVFRLSEHVGVEKGSALAVLLDGRPLGWLGRLEAPVGAKMDLKGTFCVGELDLDPLFALGVPVARMHEIHRYPSIERDLSLIVPEVLRWEELEGSIRENAPAELVEVRFGEVFRGKALAEGTKSVFVRMVFRSLERSLTHPEVDGWQQSMVTRLESRLGAKLRT